VYGESRFTEVAVVVPELAQLPAAIDPGNNLNPDDHLKIIWNGMIARVDTMARRTTLQRLQNLEDDFKSLEDQLAGLCDVLRAPTLLTQDPAEHASRTKTADGRLDWALRWVLNKLQAAEAAGAEYARRNQFA